MFALYITGATIRPEWKVEMTRYIAHHVNEDGGWGMHLEDATKLYSTTLYYVVLRILGMSAAHPLAAKAREKLLSLGKSPPQPKVDTIPPQEGLQQKYKMVC